MEIEVVKCECCGLKEECTQGYIKEVSRKFEGKWLCGLCSEAVRDEASRGKKQSSEAVRAHMSFCRKYSSNNNNPAIRVADGMMQMLRRRTAAAEGSPTATSSLKRYSGTSQVPEDSGFSY